MIHYKVIATELAIQQSPFSQGIKPHLAIKKYCEASLKKEEWTQYTPRGLQYSRHNHREHCFAFADESEAFAISLMFYGLFTFTKLSDDNETDKKE